jgi:hypothetical protein
MQQDLFVLTPADGHLLQGPQQQRIASVLCDVGLALRDISPDATTNWRTLRNHARVCTRCRTAFDVYYRRAAPERYVPWLAETGRATIPSAVVGNREQRGV